MYSIVPGWYSGRAVHFHIKVYTEDNGSIADNGTFIAGSAVQSVVLSNWDFSSFADPLSFAVLANSFLKMNLWRKLEMLRPIVPTL